MSRVRRRLSGKLMAVGAFVMCVAVCAGASCRMKTLEPELPPEVVRPAVLGEIGLTVRIPEDLGRYRPGAAARFIDPRCASLEIVVSGADMEDKSLSAQIGPEDAGGSVVLEMTGIPAGDARFIQVTARDEDSGILGSGAAQIAVHPSVVTRAVICLLPDVCVPLETGAPRMESIGAKVLMYFRTPAGGAETGGLWSFSVDSDIRPDVYLIHADGTMTDDFRLEERSAGTDAVLSAETGDELYCALGNPGASAMTVEITWHEYPGRLFDPYYIGAEVGAGGFTDINSGAQALWPGRDGSTNHITSTISLDFSFPFGGAWYDELVVSSNGYIAFTSENIYSSVDADDFSARDYPVNLIALFMGSFVADFERGFQGYCAFDGSGDGRRCTIQFDSVRLRSQPDISLSGQVVVYASGEIELRYRTPGQALPAGEELAAGLKNNAGTDFRGPGLLTSALPAEDLRFALTDNLPPTAVMNMPPAAYAGTGVAFSAEESSDPDGNIASWFWDFGDGASSEGITANHSYADSGNYTVSLTCTDSKGAASRSKKTIRIGEDSGIDTIIISELLFSSFDDAVELHNPTLSPVSIGGWTVGIYRSESSHSIISLPGGTVLAPLSCLVVTEADFDDELLLGHAPVLAGDKNWTLYGNYRARIYLEDGGSAPVDTLLLNDSFILPAGGRWYGNPLTPGAEALGVSRNYPLTDNHDGADWRIDSLSPGELYPGESEGGLLIDIR